MRKKKSKIRIFKSSGNVFTDLGLANAQEKQTKVCLAVAIAYSLINLSLRLCTHAPARQ
jgi:hypothetical protein